MTDTRRHEELEKRILELEQAVSKHKQSEEEFNQIFSMSLDMLCVADINTATFLKVNPAFTETLGYSEEELLEKPFIDFIHPEDIDSTRSIVEEKLLLGAKAINFENRYRCKDGSYRWLSWMSHPTPEKGVTYAVARDVTESKLAEERILLKQRQLTVISEIGMLANSTLSIDGVLEGILKSTIETLNASAGIIFLKDPVTGSLSLEAFSGLSKDFVSDFQNRPVQPCEELSGRIAQTGEPVYIAFDSSHDPRIVRPSIKEEELNSFIGVPLYAADKIVGVMNILTRSPDILTEDDMQLCAAVGSNVGLAIRNAKAFDKQKQSEGLLRESEERFKALSNLTFEGIVLHNNGVVIDSNDAVTKMLGYSKEELIGINIVQLCVLKEYHALLGENIVKKKAKPYEVMARRKDGTVLPVEVESREIGGGNKEFRVAALRDITERRMSEEALRESEKRFRELFNNMSSGVAIYDAATDGSDFIFKDINRAGLDSSQLEHHQLIGKSVQDVFPAIRKMGLFDVFRRVWKTGVPEHFPSAQYEDNRITLWVENYVCKIPSGEIVAIYEDVTKRKKTEQELIRAKEEWALTFDAMNDIVTIQDKDMRIVRANKAAHEFFQEKHGELKGKYCYELFTGKSEPCQSCPLLDTREDKNKHSKIMHHKNMGKIFLVSSAVITTDDKKLQYLVHVAKDITEQKKLEEELFQAHKMEAMGTLAGGIAHDFNNILSAIMGYSELALLNIPASNSATQDIEQVIQSSKRAADLVQQILTFSRKSEHHVESISPYLIIKEALKMLRASLPVTIAILEDIDKECGRAMVDPTNIHQIIVNLCTNALHAMENEKGILRVNLKRKELSVEETRGEHGVSPGPFIVLEVSDTGHGMNQATIEHIFEPYFTTKEFGKGTGLGLAVTHGIVHDYHGFIRVQSELGKGTSFRVHIPALQQELSITDKTEDNELLLTGTEQILVVDDESTIVKLIKTMLEQLGYKVSVTTESQDALEKVRNDPDQFDLIISDQTMPNLTGAELAQKVLKIRPDMPIILCSGYSSVLSEEDALAIGIKKYARKPLNRIALAKAVRDVLDGKK